MRLPGLSRASAGTGDLGDLGEVGVRAWVVVVAVVITGVIAGVVVMVAIAVVVVVAVLLVVLIGVLGLAGLSAKRTDRGEAAWPRGVSLGSSRRGEAESCEDRIESGKDGRSGIPLRMILLSDGVDGALLVAAAWA